MPRHTGSCDSAGTASEIKKFANSRFGGSKGSGSEVASSVSVFGRAPSLAQTVSDTINIRNNTAQTLSLELDMLLPFHLSYSTALTFAPLS